MCSLSPRPGQAYLSCPLEDKHQQGQPGGWVRKQGAGERGRGADRTQCANHEAQTGMSTV